MYRFTIPNLPGGLEIVGEVDTEKEVFERVHFWQSLPNTCPIDGSPTILLFKEPADNKYYGLYSTGPVQYEFKIGQHKTGGTLFSKNQWTRWDGEKETTIWENGKLTPEGQKIAQPTTPPKTRPAPPPEVKFQTPPKEEPTKTEPPTLPAYRDGIDPKAVLRSGDVFSFKDQADAIAFAVAAGAYPDAAAAAQPYANVKAEGKPAKAFDMWQLWLSHVAGRLNEMAEDKETWK